MKEAAVLSTNWTSKTIPLITKRETTILHLIANGMTALEISSHLFISFDTVNTHRKSLIKKLKAKNTASMITAAFDHQILKPKLHK